MPSARDKYVLHKNNAWHRTRIREVTVLSLDSQEFRRVEIPLSTEFLRIQLRSGDLRLGRMCKLSLSVPKVRSEEVMHGRIEEYHCLEDLQPLAGRWRELLEVTPGASFFHTLEWLRVYWRHFGHDQRLRVVVIYRDELLIAIVPLVVRRENKKIAQVRVLTYPLHDWGSFYGPIAADPASALAAALRYVRRTPRDWDLIDLRWIDESASSGTLAALQQARYRVHEHVWKRCAMVDTTGRWDDYLASRRQKFRGSLRRYARRLAERGEVVFERYRPAGTVAGDDDPRWEDYDACVALARRSWQGASQDGTTLSHEAIMPFLRDAHRAAVNVGALDLNLLRLDGRLVAFAYNYQWQGKVYGLRVGYDPEHAHVGVGKVLWARSFQDSFEREDTSYDLGPDSLDIKRPWLTHVAPVLAFAHYPKTAPKGQLLRLATWMRDRTSRSAIPEDVGVPKNTARQLAATSPALPS